MERLPEDFIFGAATAAFQAEGAVNEDGRGKCYWDEYLHRAESTFNGDTASDFYHKYREDTALCKEYGINGIRISIAWTRIIPDGSGKVNQKGIDFYNDMINACLEAGVEPYVTLHHFDTPLELFKNGDWLNRENTEHFVRFAKICFENFGDRVKKWITINEPWSVVAGQYIIGHFPPNIKYDVPKAVQAMHNMCTAHAKAVIEYKKMNLDGEIGIIHILESKYPISEKPEDIRAALLEDTLANKFMLDASLKGSYSESTMQIILEILEKYNAKLDIKEDEPDILKKGAELNDFLGVNYYASHFLKGYEGETEIYHNGTGKKGTSIFRIKGVGERVKNPEIETTDWDWPIYPKGLYDMLVRIKNEYPECQKLYVTENGMGYKDEFINGKIEDIPRIDYIKKHLAAINQAITAGVNVKGYFVWSLMDVLSWTNGFNKRYGLFYVDFQTQKRYPKKSAYWYKETAESKVIK